MKKYLLFVSLLVLISCSPNRCWDGPCQPIPGNTKANGNQQAVASNSMFVSVSSYLPSCNKKNMKIINTRYKEESKNGIWWQEIWTVEACGTQWQKTFDFSTDGQISRGIKLEKVK